MNLIPNNPGKTPSYWFTWGVQNHSLGKEQLGNQPMNARVFEGSRGARLARTNLSEKLVFQNPAWITNFYSKVRGDLYVVFDDGWDVPYGVHPQEERWRFGSLELNEERFPSCSGTPKERLRKLNEKVKAVGWRGAGLWLAAQCMGDGKDDGRLLEDYKVEKYWRERAKWCHYAGIEYWKVDWGMRCNSLDFRRMLTHICREETPNIVVEHAVCSGPLNDAPDGEGRFHSWHDICRRSLETIAFSDVFRTYDVTRYLSVATTLDRVAELFTASIVEPGAQGLLNSEEEVYLGAALGCALGIGRHPLWRERSGQDYDPRQLRKRADEVARAVRWQRLAPAFGIDKSKTIVDKNILTDSWYFKRGDTWASSIIGKEITQSAPARVARGIGLPRVEADGLVAFVIASRNPNGAIAIATVPRTSREKGIFTPLVDVSIDVGEGHSPIGIFGFYRTLTLNFSSPLSNKRIWAQDLASDEAVDVTDQIIRVEKTVTLTGDLINKIGLTTATPGDVSDPGLVLFIQ